MPNLDFLLSIPFGYFRHFLNRGDSKLGEFFRINVHASLSCRLRSELFATQPTKDSL
jgi:hypothetical protein